MFWRKRVIRYVKAIFKERLYVFQKSEDDYMYGFGSFGTILCIFFFMLCFVFTYSCAFLI